VGAFHWKSRPRLEREVIVKPWITCLTLGVDDLKRSLKFYQDGLGLKTRGIVGEEFEYGEIVFFDLRNNLRLTLYPRKSLAKDANLTLAPTSSTEFSIGHNVNTKKEVDQVMDQAKKSGAKIVKRAQKTFWGGYSGYFKDPDGHLWEIAWHPDWKIPV
jgi:uncharacterized glyoxalase superfamily protein PhnB